MYSENVNVKIRIKKAYTLKSVLHLFSHWSQLYFVRESEKSLAGNNPVKRKLAGKIAHKIGILAGKNDGGHELWLASSSVTLTACWH